MIKINKEDLKYKYSWTTIGNDDPRIKGVPDSTMFNRHEGFEVIYLINKLAEIWKFEKKASCFKIEKMINDNLPSNVRSQKNVKQWIADNWEKY